MKAVHQEPQQTAASDDSDRNGKRCAPAAHVPDGLEAPELMVIHFGRDEPRATAEYLEERGNPNLQVSFCPTGKCLLDITEQLQTIANKLEALYVAFHHQRQERVHAMTATTERMLQNLQDAPLSESEKQQVFRAFKNSTDAYDEDYQF